MARSHTPTTIALSSRAFWYFLGYHTWQAIRRWALWIIVLCVAVTSFGLIKTGQISGMNDKQIASAFLSGIIPALTILVIGAAIYGLIRATMATFTTRYHLTRQGIMTEVGWLTQRTTIVNYDQIQKMTIVANPFDRVLGSAYIHLDLIGGGQGVALEAIDAKAVSNLQQRLSLPSAAVQQISTKSKSAAKPITQSKPSPKAPSEKADTDNKKATKKNRRKVSLKSQPVTAK